jgi:hypothetical protein
MKYAILALLIIITFCKCTHKSIYPIKPGLTYTSVNYKNIDKVDSTTNKLFQFKFGFTVNATSMPSDRKLIKRMELTDLVHDLANTQSTIQDLPASPSGTSICDAEAGVTLVEINTKKWTNTKGVKDSVRYSCVIVDYQDRRSDSVITDMIYLQY